MPQILTYWEDPKSGNISGDDFEDILEVRIKSVKEIPDLIASKPKHCTMISLEYSGNHTRNGKITNPNNPRRFKELWRKGEPFPTTKPKKCPLCGHVSN